MEFQRPDPPAVPLFLSAAGRGRQHEINQIAGQSMSPAAAVTWVANLVAYMPFTLPWDYPVFRVWWLNGSTTSGTNVQLGIYTEDGVRVWTSGSIAMGTASTIQYVTLATPLLLPRGRYYLAWTCDNTTVRGCAHSGSAVAGAMSGLLEETPGAFGLPATMAAAVRWARVWGYSCCGLTRTASGF